MESEEDEECTTLPREYRQQLGRQGLENGPEESTTTTEASAEDRQHVKEIGDNARGGSGSTTGPVDCQWQRSVDYPCYRVANSKTLLSLSRQYLVFVLFSSDYFPPVHCKEYYQNRNRAKNILLLVYITLLYVYPTYTRVKNYKFSWSIKTYIKP